jgi:peroxiredoxin/mono/diheme cytochrome c family protein
MSKRSCACMVLIALIVLPNGHAAPRGEPAPAESRKAIHFQLKDPRDQANVSLAGLKEKKAVVIVFLGTECPLSNQFLAVLADLHKEYEKKSVAFVGINANAQDSLDRLAAHSREHNIPFPVVKDPGNKVADQFGARRTPEAFVLDGSGKILYQGRIDDQFGIGYARPGKPTRRDLALALDEVLAGKTVSVARTKAAGCLIGRVAAPKTDGAITYAKHVSRILQQNCQECHRPGYIGPMSLLSFDDAVSWSDTIREVVEEGRMPPWHADPRHGKFRNDRRLSKEDRDTLLAWLDGGTPRGEEKDLPPPRKFIEGWSIGEPDLVLKMPRVYEVPARTTKAGIPYQYFTVDPGFKEDRWIQRAEARAGAPSVVHHVVVFIVPKGEFFNPDAPGAVLCGTAPGDMPMMLPEGYAKKVPAGARLIFQMHYTPNGKPARDQSSVGLVFAKEPPRRRVITRPVYNASFIARLDKIPAGAANYKIEAQHVFKQDVHLLHFMPHMHLRGKDFLYEAVYPDGKKETLLSVPRYDFNWQSVYRLADPLSMPKGTRLHCVAHFDNSADNPNNPDPTRAVYWGDQTWEEMMIGWIDYFVDDENPRQR